MNLSKKFILLLFFAIILRIVIGFWSLQFRENIDVLRYKDWAVAAYLYGFAGSYESRHMTFGTVPNNQPPGSVYILTAAYTGELQVAKIVAKVHILLLGVMHGSMFRW